MNRFLGAAGAFALIAVVASPAAAVAPLTQATAKATIYKPLQISFVQSLDFGILVTSTTGTWSQVINMDQAGTLTGCGANVSCSGSTQPAKYHLVGTNNALVKITAPGFNMTGNPSGSIAFAPNAPPSVNLGASGLATGVDFSIGGSITVTNTTPDGVYTGNFLVTADYQ
jgi:hypothetical protein